MLFCQLLIGFLVNFEVAPLAGAWIEIDIVTDALTAFGVAPLAGAWIEIAFIQQTLVSLKCRSPRGSVD